MQDERALAPSWLGGGPLTPRALRLVPSVLPASRPSRDTAALVRIAAGDVGALGEVYDRHAAALLRFASRAAGPGDAEDLVQGTFMVALRVAGTYDGRAESARSWLYGILARLMQERRRSLRRFARALIQLAAPSPRAPVDASIPLRPDLQRGLSALSEAKRVVVLLAEVEGYSCEEIAGILHIPVGTVWTRLHHARRDLRAFFGERAE
ncbi:MAG: RNA polymerase sigma factor [Polyangiaceae bacterium]|nr:RNA polymerase sigma factor [Polyangiaceae bacterium]